MQGLPKAHDAASMAASALDHFGRVLPLASGSYNHNEAITVLLSHIGKHKGGSGAAACAVTLCHQALDGIVASMAPEHMDMAAGILVDVFADVALSKEGSVDDLRVTQLGRGVRALQRHFCSSGNSDSNGSQQHTCSKLETLARCLQPHVAVNRVQCLEDLLHTRCSVVIVGPPGCGKTTTWQLLQAALFDNAVSTADKVEQLHVAVHRVRALELLSADNQGARNICSSAVCKLPHM